MTTLAVVSAGAATAVMWASTATLPTALSGSVTISTVAPAANGTPLAAPLMMGAAPDGAVVPCGVPAKPERLAEYTVLPLATMETMASQPATVWACQPAAMSYQPDWIMVKRDTMGSAWPLRQAW